MSYKEVNQNITYSKENGNIPDTSIERLEKTFHKTIDKGYLSMPTNDKYVVTQKQHRGKVQFPLILIKTQMSEELREVLKSRLRTVSPVGDDVLIVYQECNTAVPLINTKGNKAVIDILETFCLDFDYFISKGVKLDNFDFNDQIDFEAMIPLIVPDEEELEDFVKDVPEIFNKDCDNILNEIESILKAPSKTDVENLLETITSASVKYRKTEEKTTEYNLKPAIENAMIEQESKVNLKSVQAFNTSTLVSPTPVSTTSINPTPVGPTLPSIAPTPVRAFNTQTPTDLIPVTTNLTELNAEHVDKNNTKVEVNKEVKGFV